MLCGLVQSLTLSEPVSSLLRQLLLYPEDKVRTMCEKCPGRATRGQGVQTCPRGGCSGARRGYELEKRVPSARVAHTRPDSHSAGAAANVKPGRNDSPLWRHTVPMSGSCPWGLLVLGTDAAISGSGKDSPRRRGGTVRPGRAGWRRRAITCGLCAEGASSFQPLPQGPEDRPLVPPAEGIRLPSDTCVEKQQRL